MHLMSKELILLFHVFFTDSSFLERKQNEDFQRNSFCG